MGVVVVEYGGEGVCWFLCAVVGIDFYDVLDV